LASQTIIQQTIKIRDRLEKSAYVGFYKAIRAQYNDVLDYIDVYNPVQLRSQVASVVYSNHIQKAMIGAYTSAAVLALMQRNRLMGEKSDMWEDIFIEQMKLYVMTTQAEMIQKITVTTQKFITNVIDEAIESGLGIDDVSRLILKGLTGKDALTITRSRARTIARTEILKANAVAQNKAVESLGFAIEKKWLDSGLEGVRESHVSAASEGWVGEEHVFGNGCKQPGDPNGAIGEIINCRCVLDMRRKGVNR
jgi:hypothetical protein